MVGGISQGVKLPAPAAIAQLIGLLVDRRVTAARSRATFELATMHYVAVYIDDQGRDAVLCLADRALIAACGAALALIPPAVAAADVRTGNPSELLLANAYEVLNVLATAFNEVAPSATHVRLRTLRPTTDYPLVPTRMHLRLDLEVTILNYATGKLAVIPLAI